MKDRLAELREIQQDLPPEYEDTSLPEKLSSFNDFFSQIGEIQQDIGEICERVQDIKKMHSAILSAPHSDEKMNQDLEQAMAHMQRLGNRVKTSLKGLESVIKSRENEGNFADLRIKKNQHLSLSQEFVRMMTEYNTMQTDYKEKCKNRIKRQLKIANRSITDEQLEEMIESKNSSIFVQDIVTDTQQAKQSVQEIEARHNDILKLETSIRELHEIFTDMALLVQCQGEMIDRIEYNVEQAEVYVKATNDNFRIAVTYQRKGRKKKMMIIVCIVLLLVIIGVTVYVSLM